MTRSYRAPCARLVRQVAFVAAALGAAFSARAAQAADPLLHVTADLTLSANRNGPIIIDADNVTLDCDHHSVTGPGASTTTGIGISARGRTNVMITNCYVSGFGTGIDIYNTSYAYLRNNRTLHNRYGVFVFQSAAALVEGLTSSNNTSMGLVIQYTTGGIFIVDDLSENQYGIALWNNAVGNEIDGVGVDMLGLSANHKAGLSIAGGSNDNHISGLRVFGSDGYAVEVRDSTGNSLENMLLIENGFTHPDGLNVNYDAPKISGDNGTTTLHGVQECERNPSTSQITCTSIP